MWFYFALASAIISGISTIINKKTLLKVSPSLLSWSLSFFSLPFLFVLMLRENFTHLNWTFFIAATLSSLVFTFSKTISLDSLKKGFLSDVFPLSSFNAFFTYLLGLIFLGENPFFSLIYFSKTNRPNIL